MIPVRIALATINRDAPSETFIRAHVSRLPAEVHFMTGGALPNAVSIGLGGPIVRLDSHEGPARVHAVAAYFKEMRIDAVLAEYGPVGVAMQPVCEAANLPLTVHFHGYDAYRQDVLGADGPSYPSLFQFASAIVASSQPMRDQLRALGAPLEKLHVNPYGYEPGIFSPRGDAGLRPPLFLAVGRLVEKKGPVLTIRAFDAVRRKLPRAQLVMIGSGPIEAACGDEIDQLGLQESVRMLGALSHAEVAHWMSRARVFVQHSLTPASNDHEGTPVSILEAMGSGLPVVSTRHAGIPDVVVDGVTGFLCNEGDVARMGEAMLRLGSDNDLATMLGRAAHARASAHFSMSARIQSLWEIICRTVQPCPAS